MKEQANEGRKSPIFCEIYTDIVREMWGNTGSKRTMNNRYWLQFAYSLLHGKPKYAWLFERHEKSGKFKRTTLITELGRLEEPELIKAATKQVCEEKPAVTEAVARLRKERLENQTDTSA